jgi:hypothetical protein
MDGVVMTMPTCGAQQPGNVPSPFDWWPIASAGVIAGIAIPVYTNGIPIINGIIHAISGAAPLLPGVGVVSAFVGAAAVLALVAYFALQPDGCIRSLPQNVPVCLSGLVQYTTDTSSDAIDALAPFAIPPLGYFDVVVDPAYWDFVTKDAFWVNCTPAGGAMIRCVVKDDAACGGKIGALAGAALGAIAGTVLGYLAGLACALTGALIVLCIIAAFLVAAAVTYLGAMIGGWIGEAIGSAGSGSEPDSQWPSLEAGVYVTVKGNLATEPSAGYNELLYVTNIAPSMQFLPVPSTGYTADDAHTAFMTVGGDDCSTNIIM